MSEKSVDIQDQHPLKSAPEDDLHDVERREGDVAGWLTVLGSALVYYASFGILNSFGFFQTFYANSYLESTPTSTIAFIGTVQMALMNSLAAVSGALCDRYGVKYLYLGSGCGTSVSLLILSFTAKGQFWQVFLIQGLFMGLSIAFGVQPAITIVGQHFQQRRALAMGLVSSGSALGGIGFPLMFEQLVPRVGIANALRLAALKIGVCYTIALCISSSRPRKDQDCRSCGGLIDFKGFLDMRYTVLCIGTFFAVLGLWIPPYYLKMYTNSAYPGNSTGKYFLCFLNGSSIIGAVFGGLVGDMFGRLNLLWIMTVCSGALCLLFWLLGKSIAVIVAFSVLYGFTASSVTSLPSSVIGQMTPDGSLGARIGAFYSVVAVASLIGTPIGGALITDTKTREGYVRLICFSGGAMVFGASLMLVSRLLHDTNMRKKW